MPKLNKIHVYTLAGAILLSSLLLISVKAGLLDLRDQPDRYEIKGYHSETEQEIINGTAADTSIWRTMISSVDPDSSIQFVFVYDEGDCYSCVRREVRQLNQLSEKEKVGVTGFMLANQSDKIKSFNKSVSIKFPTIINENKGLKETYNSRYGITPTVLVISSDGSIVGVQRAIPKDVKKSSSFYKKWNRIIDNNIQ